jgi:hypothetical protein
MVAAMSIIIGGISDGRETSTPDSNVLAIRVGFNFHKRIAGDEGRVKPYRNRIINWTCTMSLTYLIRIVERREPSSESVDTLSSAMSASTP